MMKMAFYRLSSIAYFRISRRIPLNNRQRAERQGSYPYYGANGQVDTIDEYLFDGDYILLAEDGGYFDNPSRGVAYEVSGRFWVNNHAHILSPKFGIPHRYLTYALNSLDWMPFVSGSTKLKLTQEGMRKVQIPLPPLAEQRRIVAKLDALFARSRAARAELARVPRLAERAKQAVLAKAFSGELTADWRTANPHIAIPDRAHFDNERRNLFFVEEAIKGRYQSPETIPSNTPFQLPNNWLWFRAEAVCDFITKGTTPPSASMTSGGVVPYIKVYNLTFDASLDFEKEPTFISTETHEGILQRSKVFPGDILMNIVGPPLGKVSLVPNLWPEWNINQAIAVFRPVKSLNRQFLAYWLLSNQVLNWAVSLSKATAGQHNLTLQICRDIPVPLCSLAEQHEIVRRIEAAFARIDRMAGEAERAAALLERLEQATLAKAFRGELLAAAPLAEVVG